MIQILDNAVMYHSPRLGSSPKDLITLSAICKYRVTNLAEKLGVSIRTLERDFQKYLACTPKTWLSKQRMSYAKRLLLSGCTIGESAERLGFASTMYFSNEFKLHAGLSPQKWMAAERVQRLQQS